MSKEGNSIMNAQRMYKERTKKQKAVPCGNIVKMRPLLSFKKLPDSIK